MWGKTMLVNKELKKRKKKNLKAMFNLVLD